ncbi:MAG: ATP-dependent DNA helicase RecG [Gammaproteobacteria bacterium]|nr:ATP-dependent DNA helicase RecG [Gammaproteobacteria bacterium]
MTTGDKSYDIMLLKGVGEQIAKRLSCLGISNIRDLLFHLPLRYQDRTRVVPINKLTLGSEVVVQGTVKSSSVQFGKRRSLLCNIYDNTGSLRLRFFHFTANQKTALVEGAAISCFGEVRSVGPHSRYSAYEMIHPEYRVGNNYSSLQTANHLTPVYPTTDGLQQRSIRTLVEQALIYLEANPALLHDWIPEELLDKMDVMSLVSAIYFLHRPPENTSATELADGRHPSQQRLLFEELLARHLCLRQLRNKIHKKNAIAISADNSMTSRIDKILPYTLTEAQKRCISSVLDDISMDHPMQRLVQGDVGCGKTMVAIYSAFHVAAKGYQVAIMAPTEILAEQHFINITSLANSLDLQTVLIAGKIKGKARDRVLNDIKSGAAQIIIGTHAIFQQEVHFAKLAYIIVDEQQRFGVLQRLSLLKKGFQNGRYPHQLIMSATPIPRSLAMSIYADLDCSIIDEMPPGRSAVSSIVVADNKRDEVLSRIHKACSEGRQAYWVCPLIDESEVLQCQAAVETFELLSNTLSNLSIGLIHGRMKPKEKEHVMSQFKQKKLDILVATTVIEVGVDVPNASLMLIENTERLGLSQLHQLRGRIGRGTIESSCIFMYSPPLSKLAYKRLSIIRSTNDGFEIAREDMNLRGPGEVFGTQQTGLMQLKIAELPRDEYILPKVKEAAEYLLEKYPQASHSLIERWVGQSTQYWEA